MEKRDRELAEEYAEQEKMDQFMWNMAFGMKYQKSSVPVVAAEENAVAANNKVGSTGAKKTGPPTNSLAATKTSPQKAETLGAKPTAGTQAKPIVFKNINTEQVKTFISTEVEAQAVPTVSSIQNKINAKDRFLWAQPVYITTYNGKTYILDGHNRLKAVATHPTGTNAPVTELSNEKAREMFKDKMNDIEAGKFNKTINDD